MNPDTSTYSPVFAVSQSPLRVLDSEQSVSVKLTPTHQPSCESIGLKSQTTETLETSKETNLKILLSLQEGFRVSLSQSEGNNLEIATKGTYGLNSLESSAKYDRNSHSLRTYQTCFQLTEGEPSTESLATFARSGMIVSGILYQLSPLVQIIKEIGFGSLPTPMASDGMAWIKTRKSNVRQSILKAKKDGGTIRISYLWQWRGFSPMKAADLNEMMMGYPRGWTDLSASETQSFQASQESSSKKSSK